MYMCRGSRVLTVITLGSFVMTAVFPFMNGLFVDFLIYDKSVDMVIRFALILAAVGALGVLLTYVAGIVFMRVTNETAFSVLADLVSRLERANLGKR
jgi:ABC-type bacteriocin/lantibiotic exporter with double-glycine peptidase domain